jgi:hypothetical protein
MKTIVIRTTMTTIGIIIFRVKIIH